MTGHARLSASQTKQWAACPGSVAYLEAHPELGGSSGYHAQHGTAAHALVERCLKEGSEPSEYKGRLIEILEGENGDEGTSILKKGAKWPKQATRIVFEVDVDMYEAVECMTDYVRNRCVELDLVPDEVLFGEGPSLAKVVTDLVKKGTVRLEAKVIPLPERDDTGGTGDVIIDAWPTLLEIVDYKHGSGVFVPVDGNEQLRSYGLGALQEAGADDYENVRYTICQPRHLNSPRDGIMYEETTAKELMDWKHWLTAAADRVDDARAMIADGATLEELFESGFLSVGEDGGHCTFCDLKSTTGSVCPAALAKVQEQAMTDFDDDPADIDSTASANHLAVLLPWIPFIDKWAKAIVAEAEQLLMSGGKIDGRKVVRKRSSGRKYIEQRKIAPEKEGDEPTYVDVTEADRVEALVGYGADEADLYTKPVFLSGPKAEKLIPKKDRQEFSDNFMYTPEGGLTIAPESDKREAVLIDPASDFDDVED